MIGFLLPILGKLGSALIGYHNKKANADHAITLARIESDTSAERVRAELAGVLAHRQTGLIKSAMSHSIFWVVWGLFAIPLGLWWALVMIDTMTPAHVLSLRIPALPPSIVPYADQIFNNVFYSGAGMGAIQLLGRAVMDRKP